VGLPIELAKNYAKKLDTPFAYSTNGLRIYQVEMKTGQENYIDRYPTPDELWNATFSQVNEWRDKFAKVPFEDLNGTKELRYYQHNAVKKFLEALCQGKDRILLTLATGTGKTFIAFQIAWKLFQSRWTVKQFRDISNSNQSRRPRILFLADRNILANQAKLDFSAFPDDALVRIDPAEIKKKGRVPKNGSVFFTIFQTFMTGKDEDGNPTPKFSDYPPNFFDLIIIDECHRGGAKDESSWRGILEYFSPAIQLGLTATPKKEINANTYTYFGDPVYTYALKDGINDGYLSPFKVRQIETSLDEYRYDLDDDIIEGNIDEEKVYTEAEFNRIIEIEERERYRVELFMEEINQNEKTIVFCVNQDHALAVRDLINQIKINPDPNYCVRVTANDGKVGETYLEQFQDSEKTIPTILTTSQKLSTGVNARNVRNIVLMRPINSIIEFKQIIGRGTRLFEGKDYFTIYDFVKAYEHFNDPAWDGEPLEPVQRTPRSPKSEEELRTTRERNLDNLDNLDNLEPPEVTRPEKIKIKLADGKEREIIHSIKTSFWSPEGKPLSAVEFVERLFGDIPEMFRSEDELRTLWSRPDTRKALLEGLAEKGYGDEQLTEISRLVEAEKSDLYDVLAYLAYAIKPISREDRTIIHKSLIFSRYTGKQQEFLDFVLEQYVKEGVRELDSDKLKPLLELKYHAIQDAIAELGNVASIRETFIGFQQYLYSQDQAA
jgi:type I restriction enzyme R subunit